jgi:predicted MFS family arabinose efflux permease
MNSAPPQLTRGLLVLLFATIFIAASTIHYQVPMLALLADEFGASAAEIGWLPTLTQLGFCLGIAFLTPLGDRFNKKRLIQFRLVGCALTAIVFATADALPVLIAAGLVMGIFASTSQDVVPLVAELARPEERGRAVGTVLSGLLLGIMAGRVAGGFFADVLGWRVAYWILLAALVAVSTLVAWRVPNVRPHSTLSYSALLRSIAGIIRDQPSLRRASAVQGLLGICYGAFWATLAVMMATLHGAGSSAVGLIAIPGAAGTLIARPVGKWVDAKGPRPAVTLGIALVIIGYVALGFAAFAIAAVVLGAMLLDGGIRATSVSNQAYYTGIDAASRSRMNTVFVLHMFGGNALGALIGSTVLASGGWLAVCATCLAFSTCALIAHWRSGVIERQSIP